MIKLTYNEINIPYDLIKFPVGETHIKVTKPFDKISIYYQSNDDILNALFLLDKNPNAEIYMPYFPYERQNKKIIKDDILPLNVIGKLFAGKKVTILDPYSIETIVSLNTVHWSQKSQLNLFLSVYNKDIYSDVVLLASHKEIENKVKLIAESLNLKYYLATPKYDIKTNKFIEFKIPNIIEKNILIIDNICNTGNIFLALANKLYDKNLHLWTTHGVYNKGTELLLEKFKTIYCYNYVPNGKPIFFT